MSSSYRGDDLTPVLAKPPPGPGVGYRQGVVVAWNQATAENVIDVAGSLLPNLPILNTNEALQLQPGDVVFLLTAGSSWFILGRVTIPGSAQAASSLAAVFAQIKVASDASTGTRNNASFGDLAGTDVGPEVTTQISNAGRALVLWSADMGQTADWRPFLTGGVSVQVSGATTIAASSEWSLGPHQQHPASPAAGNALVAGGFQGGMMHLFENLTPGSNTFTLKYRTRSTPGDVDFAARQIAVLAM